MSRVLTNLFQIGDDSYHVTPDDRPDQFAVWMKYARKLTHKPKIDDSKIFGGDLRIWYVNVLPEWRTKGVETGWRFSRAVPETGDVWKKMEKKAGGNGTFLVVLGLLWWRDIAKTDEEKADIKAALDDFAWTLQHLYLALKDKPPPGPPSSPQKRPAPEDDDSPVATSTKKTKRAAPEDAPPISSSSKKATRAASEEGSVISTANKNKPKRPL